MAEYSTIARPYARAAFEHAQGEKALDAWADQLATLASLAASDEIRPLLTNPAVPPEDIAEGFTSALGKSVDEGIRNFVRLLADNRRLPLLGEIEQQFEAMRAEAEGRITVDVISARELDEKAKKRMIDALAKRLDRKVELACRTDESLIGGAVVRAGDWIIDGSVKGQLERLSAAMNH